MRKNSNEEEVCGENKGWDVWREDLILLDVGRNNTQVSENHLVEAGNLNAYASVTSTN